MTPQYYLTTIVMPTLKEYEADTASRRRAYLACIVTSHLTDFLEKAGANDPQAAMRKQCAAKWQVVHAISNGAKHGDNEKNRNPLKFAAGSDHYRPPAVAGVMECGSSELGDEEGSIVIPAPENAFGTDVLSALRNVIAGYHAVFGNYLAAPDGK